MFGTQLTGFNGTWKKSRHESITKSELINHKRTAKFNDKVLDICCGSSSVTDFLINKIMTCEATALYLIKMKHFQLISNQCALDVAVISRKPEVHPKILAVKTFTKCNTPDFKFYPGKSTNKNFPMCNVKFSLLFFFLYCLLQWKQTQN